MAEMSGFPVLQIDPSNVYGSWKKFLKKFTVAMKFEVTSKGKKTVTVGTDTQEVNAFTDKMKVFALLKAIGDDGLEVLEGLGIDVLDEEALNYDDILKSLKSHYEREESLNVKLRNLSTACQQTGEDSRDFLRRVEFLSRSTGIFKWTETEGSNAAEI